MAGEESGDQLGAGLMRALKAGIGDVAFEGVGGRAMEGEGLKSLFPLSDIAVMGITAVLARLPSIYRRGLEAVEAVVRFRPDVLVVIDSPEFTHAVARRVRRRLPDLPIVNYVSPSVWAWRPGRAPRMRAYIDHVLALKPFEPAAHSRLGGPPCTYVGHPLVEQLHELRPAPGERRPIADDPLTLLVLPGSRRSEISRLMEPFGAALALLQELAGRRFELLLPAVPHLVEDIRARAAGWTMRPTIVEGEQAKRAAFRRANAALAASGTVTLELALSGVPMVVAYKVSKLEEQLKHIIKVPSIVLANLILGENVVPERVQWDCTPEKLAGALLPLLGSSPERQRQIEAFGRLDRIMEAGGISTPSERAAGIVVAEIERAQRRSS
ncbi:lipid-A-disaccharide synthase [Enterovirga sp. DB1703]|uniref:Lipid-A-disaccharide synthase n=1 Tax=Enterovirga aerilata TaxID=2730920 RepID=A0A849I538_9HYPH|nr:lipid-A-disaccharide synthase [Enterovirga sp. DB1703]